MARGRRHKKNPLAAYGYPGGAFLRRQARLLAASSLPSTGSINRQYGRQLNDVQGFTRALVSLLKSAGPEASAAYDPAIAQQRGIDEAAQARLAELGPEYAALGAATAEGPLSNLLGQQASQRAYASKQPGIAARSGVLQSEGVLSARQEALTQRGEALHQAVPGLFYQLQQNAAAQAQANRAFSFDQRQFAASQSQFERQFREGRRQFNVEQQRLRDQFLAEQQQAIHESPFTASQISSFMATARGQAPNAINAGVGPQQFIRDAISRGIPRAVAARAAMSAYSALAQRVEKSGNPSQFRQQNPHRWRAYDAYRHWREQIYRMQSRKGKGKRKKKADDFNFTFGF